jgi:hypothetical protein
MNLPVSLKMKTLEVKRVRKIKSDEMEEIKLKYIIEFYTPYIPSASVWKMCCNGGT